MTIAIILSSRHFQPMRVVDDFVHTTQPAAINAFGTSAVASRAVKAGELLGIPSRNTTLDSARNNLLTAAREPGARVTLFVANDPVTKAPSNGISGLMRRLIDERIAFDRIDSPCTAKTCEAATHLLAEVNKLNDRAGTEWRRKAIVKRLLARGLEADDLRRRLDAQLERGWNDAEASDQNFAVWTMWLKSYECLQDAQKLALKALLPFEAVALTARDQDAA